MGDADGVLVAATMRSYAMEGWGKLEGYGRICVLADGKSLGVGGASLAAVLKREGCAAARLLQEGGATQGGEQRGEQP